MVYMISNLITPICLLTVYYKKVYYKKSILSEHACQSCVMNSVLCLDILAVSRDGLEASCDILHQLVEEIEARGPELDAVETTGASFTASAKVRPAVWGFDSTTETFHNNHNQIRWIL